MSGLTINDMARAAHENSKAHGFWDGDLGESVAFVPEKLCLIHAEVSEALESYRDDDGVLSILGFEHHATCGNAGSCCPPDEPARPKPVGFASELADVVIRVGDLAARLGIDLERAVAVKHAYNVGRPHKHGKVC